MVNRLVHWLIVLFYGISTLSGTFNAELRVWYKYNFVYIQLNVKTVAVLTIQFSIRTQFKCQKQLYFKQFSFAWIHRLVLVDYRQDLIRCYHSELLWTREQWQWMGTLHSTKLEHKWNLTIRLFSVISGHSWEEVQSVYSEAPTDRANRLVKYSDIWFRGCFNTSTWFKEIVFLFKIPLWERYLVMSVTNPLVGKEYQVSEL